MEMNNKRYLGLDLSLSSPGFAVITLEDGQPLVLETSHVRTNSKHSHGQRLSIIEAEIKRLIETYGPFEAVIREKGFSRFPAVTQSLFRVVGVSDLTLKDYKITEISPTQVKKIVTGNGKADKAEVERCVRKMLRIDRLDYFVCDDESDAAAVVLAYLIDKGVIK